MAVKYNLDRAIAWWGFNRRWYFWNYIQPHGYASVGVIPPSEQSFYFALVLTSLPFLLAGIVLTVWRLRSAKLPLGLCILFFVPILNLIFFAVLCAIPERRGRHLPTVRRGWTAWLPTSRVGSALLSTVIVGILGAGLAVISTRALGNYGWGLFVALPFVMGLVSVLIYAGPQRRDLPSCLTVAIFPVLFAGAVLLALAAEGLICLLMAAPIGLSLALFGGAVGYLIVGNRSAPVHPAAMTLILISVPVH